MAQIPNVQEIRAAVHGLHIVNCHLIFVGRTCLEAEAFYEFRTFAMDKTAELHVVSREAKIVTPEE